MPKPTIQRAKIVLEYIKGSLYVVIFRLDPDAIIYLKLQTFETLMRNDGGEKFYHVRHHSGGDDSFHPGRTRSAVKGRWDSKRGLFEMAHSTPGQPLGNAQEAVSTDLFYVDSGLIRSIQKVLKASKDNRQEMGYVRPGQF